MNRLTLSIAEAMEVIKKVGYCAHPEVEQGMIELTGAAGTKEHDDSCVLISSRCIIDRTADLKIGRFVNISKGVYIWTHSHDYSGRTPLLVKAMALGEKWVNKMPMVIHDDVWLFESVILPQCQEIAKGVIIGTGSVVTKNIKEEYSIWAGNPAKKIGLR